MHIKEYFLLSPLLCFFFGYCLMMFVLPSKEIRAPSIIGLSSSDALRITSSHAIHLHILEEKEDNNLPANTVITQIPAPSQSMKQYQTIFCVVSRTTHYMQAPQLIGSQYANAVELAEKNNIIINSIWLNSSQPYGYCLAQIPTAGQPLTNRIITLYVSAGQKKIVLFPSLENYLVKEVTAFLNTYNLESTIFHVNATDSTHICATCRVIRQKPLAGSIIDLEKPPLIQLQVS